MGFQFGDQRFAVLFRHASDSKCCTGDTVQRPFSTYRVGPNQGVPRRGYRRRLGLVQARGRSLATPAGGGTVEVHGGQLVDPLFGGIVKVIIGRLHIYDAGFAPDIGDFVRVQHGHGRRIGVIGLIRMPERGTVAG